MCVCAFVFNFVFTELFYGSTLREPHCDSILDGHLFFPFFAACSC